MPQVLSVRSMIRSPASGLKKLGQPQCDSNFSVLRNSSAPHARHRYTPTRWLSVYSPVKGRSVPALRSTSYSSGESCWRHSASVLETVAAGRSALLRMPSTVPTAAAPALHAEHADDAEDDGRRDADKEEDHHDPCGRALRTTEPDQPVAERGEVLQLAVHRVRVRGASPGPVDVRRLPGRVAVLGVPSFFGPHTTRVEAIPSGNGVAEYGD